MKAAEALLLGSTTLKKIRGMFDTGPTGCFGPPDSGCALGMINRAVGGRYNYTGYYVREFPWIRNRASLPLPCEHHNDRMIMSGGGMVRPREDTVTWEHCIVHLFNQHVIDGSWSIEMLADWLRVVEGEVQTKENQHEQENKEAPAVGILG
jgi:hypothetical protein